MYISKEADPKNCSTFTQWGSMQLKERRNSYLFVTAWMDLESIMLSEVSQAVKYKYHMISPISGT